VKKLLQNTHYITLQNKNMDITYKNNLSIVKIYTIGLVVGLVSATNFFYTWCYVSLPVATFTTILLLIGLSKLSSFLIKTKKIW
jgi:hypothetical protein